MAESSFSGWAIVEIMGHQTFAGHVSEETVGGASFVRVDVPAIPGHAAFSKLFGSSSIYCITPVSEEVARASVCRYRKAPLDYYDLPEEWRDAIFRAQQAKLEDRRQGEESDQEPAQLPF